MLPDACELETCCSINKMEDIMVIFRRYYRAFLDDLDFAENVHVVLIILQRTADSEEKTTRMEEDARRGELTIKIKTTKAMS